MTAMSLLNGSARRSRHCNADLRRWIRLPDLKDLLKASPPVRAGGPNRYGLRLLYYGIPTPWAMLLSRLKNEPRRRRAPAKAQDSVGQRVTGESTHQ